jgi:hypothetical protein
VTVIAITTGRARERCPSSTNRNSSCGEESSPGDASVAKGAMRKFGRRIVTLVALTMLAACAVQQPGAMVDRKLTETDPAKMGVVVGSFGKRVADKDFAYQNLLIRRLPSSKEDVTVTFQGNLDDYPPDFNDGTTHATIFALRLPEGWYEICNFRLTQAGGYATVTYFARGDFNFPFQVEAGKAVYVGEYLARVIQGRNFLGIPVTSGAYFEIDDKRARDLEFAKTKWPDVDYSNPKDFIPDVAALKHPLFKKAGQQP